MPCKATTSAVSSLPYGGNGQATLHQATPIMTGHSVPEVSGPHHRRHAHAGEPERSYSGAQDGGPLSPRPSISKKVHPIRQASLRAGTRRRSTLMWAILVLALAAASSIMILGLLRASRDAAAREAQGVPVEWSVPTASPLSLAGAAPAAPEDSWAAIATRKKAARAHRSVPGAQRAATMHGGRSVQQRSSWDADTRSGSRHIPSAVDYMARIEKGPYPIRLKYPLLWAGAFFSRSGYGTEAVSYIAGLLQSKLVSRDDVWLAQSGDEPHDVVLRTMDPGLKQMLWDQDYRNVTHRLGVEERDRPLIVVCHSFPDCWRTPEDDNPRRWLHPKRLLRAVGDMFKHSVWGVPRTDGGCPCPNVHLKDRAVYRVGRTMFETERLPKPLVKYATHVDEVWVPSEFNRASFAKSGVETDKLFTLAQGINTTLFDPTSAKPADLKAMGGALVMGKPWSGNPAQGSAAGSAGGAGVHARAHISRPFRFLSVFKWETRKGWDVLFRAFAQEFQGDDNVELHIVTKEAFEKVDNWRDYVRKTVAFHLNITQASQFADLPRVYVYHRHIPELEYPGVYKAADALVLPTHGEGWGRPQIEAMAMGLPVISTNWSGLTAFMDESVAYPIRVDGVVGVRDEGPNSFEWFRGQRWAQPSETHLRQLMRHVVENPDEAAAKGLAGRARVLRDFSLQAVAKQLLAEVLRLQDVVDGLLAEPELEPEVDSGAAVAGTGGLLQGRMGGVAAGVQGAAHAGRLVAGSQAVGIQQGQAEKGQQSQSQSGEESGETAAAAAAVVADGTDEYVAEHQAATAGVLHHGGLHRIAADQLEAQQEQGVHTSTVLAHHASTAHATPATTAGEAADVASKGQAGNAAAAGSQAAGAEAVTATTQPQHGTIAAAAAGASTSSGALVASWQQGLAALLSNRRVLKKRDKLKKMMRL